MKALGCQHAEAARALAVAWRDFGPALGGVDDPALCRQRMRDHALRMRRCLALANVAAERVRAIESFTGKTLLPYQRQVIFSTFHQRGLFRARMSKGLAERSIRHAETHI